VLRIVILGHAPIPRLGKAIRLEASRTAAVSEPSTEHVENSEPVQNEACSPTK